jgi:hypothetical protein
MANGKVAYQGGGISQFINKMGSVALTAQYQLGMSGLSKFPFGQRAQVEHMNVMCESTSLPGSRFSTATDTTYHGITSKQAYRRDFSDLNCTFYVDTSYETIRILETWMHYIHGPQGLGPYISGMESPGAFTRFRYPTDYKCDIHLLKFNKDYSNDIMPAGVSGSNSTVTYTFINAFPINLSSMAVSYGPSDLLKCTVDFAYDRYILDLVPGEGSANGPGKSAQKNQSPQQQQQQTQQDQQRRQQQQDPNPPKPQVNPDTSFKKDTITAEDRRLVAEERRIAKQGLELY